MTIENPVEPTSAELGTETEPTSVEGSEEGSVDTGAGAGAEGGEPTSEGESLYAGKYKTPEEMEKGYLNLLHQNSEVEAENADLRASDGALSRQSAPTSGSDKSGGKNVMDTAMDEATNMWKGGNYLESVKHLIQAGATQSEKSSRNRVEKLEGAVQQTAAESAIKGMMSDKASFPHLAKVEVDMSARAKKLLSAGPSVVSAYGGWTPFFSAIYAEMVQGRPELSRTGRVRAAAAAGGGGGSAPHVPGTKPVSKKAEANKKRDDAYSKAQKRFGFKVNPYQNVPSAEDTKREEDNQKFEALDRLLSPETE